MDKYQVKMMPKAYRDLDEIWWYITQELSAPEVAESLVSKIEETIIGLETFPERGAPRRIGAYMGSGYRQIFVGNYTIVYRIDKAKKIVIVITVKYSPSQF